MCFPPHPFLAAGGCFIRQGNQIFILAFYSGRQLFLCVVLILLEAQTAALKLYAWQICFAECRCWVGGSLVIMTLLYRRVLLSKSSFTLHNLCCIWEHICLPWLGASLQFGLCTVERGYWCSKGPILPLKHTNFSIFEFPRCIMYSILFCFPCRRSLLLSPSILDSKVRKNDCPTTLKSCCPLWLTMLG